MNQTYTIGQRPPRERSGSIDSDFADYTIHGRHVEHVSLSRWWFRRYRRNTSAKLRQQCEILPGSYLPFPVTESSCDEPQQPRKVSLVPKKRAHIAHPLKNQSQLRIFLFSRKAAVQNGNSITRLFVNKLPSLEGCSPDRKCCQRPWTRTQFELAKYKETLKNN